MGYSPWKTVWKGVLSFVKTSIGLAAPILLAYWADPENVQRALEAIGPLGVKYTPVVTMLITMIVNIYKNRKK